MLYVLVLFFCMQIHTANCSAPKAVKLRSEPIGIPNIGNSCFMNAALQALVALELLTLEVLATDEARIKGELSDRLRKYLIEERQMQPERADQAVAFYQHCCQFIKQYQAEPGLYLSDTRTLHQVLTDLSGLINPYEQNPTSHFFRTALESFKGSSPLIADLFDWILLDQHRSGQRTVFTDSRFYLLYNKNKKNRDPGDIFDFSKIWKLMPYSTLPITTRSMITFIKPATYLIFVNGDIFKLPFPLQIIFPHNFIKFTPELAYIPRSIILRSGKTCRTGHYIACVRYSDTWWKVDDQSREPLTNDVIEELAEKGEWDGFTPSIICYECLNLADLMRDQPAQDLSQLEKEVAAHNELIDFARELRLLSFVSTFKT